MTTRSSPPERSVKPIQWWEPSVSGEEQARVNEVLASNYLNDGSVTLEFETRIADLVRARHGVAVTSGTGALFIALAALGIGHGDEVIVPDITFIATANAVTLAGATPVLADVDPHTLILDPERVEARITRRTRAIIPVHVSGRAAPMRELLAIASRHGLKIVEDAAEALTSMSEGRCLGTFGHAGCFSFSPNKTITTGQGGMVVTDDEAMATRMRALKDQGRPVRGTGGNDVHPSIGFNFKLTNLQAAVGLGQLGKLEARTARLRTLYRLYREHLAGIDGIRLLDFDVDRGETPQWIDALAVNRDGLVAYLEARDIHCRPFWYPLHTQEPYRRPDDEFPNSSRMGPRAVWLPSAFALSDADIVRVAQQIREYYRRT